MGPDHLVGIARGRATEGGTAEAFPISVHPTDRSQRSGMGDCLSARRSHSSQSTSGPFVSGWKLQDQGGILQFSLGNRRDLEAAPHDLGVLYRLFPNDA
jgi:hypothetical protein